MHISYNESMKISDIRQVKYLKSQYEAIQAAIIKYSNMGIPADTINKLNQRANVCMQEVDRLQSVFDSINDSEIREMVSLYYDGRTWSQIHFSLYGYNSFDHGGTIRRRCERHLAKL